jgi:hypothetical protein
MGSACASHAGDGALAIANFFSSRGLMRVGIPEAFRRGRRNVHARAHALRRRNGAAKSLLTLIPILSGRIIRRLFAAIGSSNDFDFHICSLRQGGNLHR